MLLLKCTSVILSIGIIYKLAKSYELLEVMGESMYPTYKERDIVLIKKNIKLDRLTRNDIIVLEHPEVPGMPIIKRVSIVDEDFMYILGDNPSKSVDSRHFGFIKADKIEGKVVKSWRRKQT